MNLVQFDKGIYGITDSKGKIESLQKEFATQPDKYPDISGQKYWIVLFDSEGNPVEPSKGKIELSNYILKIVPLPEGGEQMHVCVGQLQR